MQNLYDGDVEISERETQVQDRNFIQFTIEKWDMSSILDVEANKCWITC